MRFAVGDLVRCVSAGESIGKLAVGADYTIDEIRPHGELPAQWVLVLKDVGGTWSASRFVPVRDDMASPPVPKPLRFRKVHHIEVSADGGVTWQRVPEAGEL